MLRPSVSQGRWKCCMRLMRGDTLILMPFIMAHLPLIDFSNCVEQILAMCSMQRSSYTAREQS